MNACVTCLLLSLSPSAPALGPPKFASFDDLIAALNSNRAERRLDAIDFLADSGVYSLKDVDSTALGHLADELLKRLSDKEEKVCIGALKRLTEMLEKKLLSESQQKKLISVLPTFFKSKTNSVRLDTAKLLVDVQPESKKLALPIVREIMADKTNAADRIAAAKLVARWSPEEKPAAVKAIRSVLSESGGSLKMGAANALVGMKEINHAEWTRQIVAAIESSKDGSDRGNMVNVLIARPWPETRAAAPAVAKMLKDPEPYARVNAAAVLLVLDPSRRDDVLATARELLKDKEHCMSAANILADLGTSAKPAIADIREALKIASPDGDERIALTRVSLLRALGKIDSDTLPEVVREVTRLLEHKSGFVKHVALLVIARCGPAAKESLPRLLKLPADDKLSVSEAQALCDVFGAIGPSAKDAIPILRRWLDLDSGFLHDRATRALGLIEGTKRD